jgi:hypothetical protein
MSRHMRPGYLTHHKTEGEGFEPSMEEKPPITVFETETARVSMTEHVRPPSVAFRVEKLLHLRNM